MNLSGSCFGVSRLSGKEYPMKMIAGIERVNVSIILRLAKEFRL
jgi:hypothetical protein